MARAKEWISEPTRRMLRRAIGENPMLGADEELALHRAWTERGDTAARDRLVMSHLPLAMKMAARLSGYGMPPDDMLGYATDGLLTAVDKFDPGRGVRFGTCARPWIKERMLVYVMRNRSMLRGPQTAAARTLFFNLARVKAALGFDGPLTPARAAAVKDMMLKDNPGTPSLTAEAVMEFERYHSTGVLSADSSTSEGYSLLDTVPDDAEPVPETLAQEEDTALRHGFIRRAVSVLSDDRQRSIFIARNMRQPALSLEELGRMYGVSRERIRQVEARAIEKVRAAATGMMAAHEEERRAAASARVRPAPTSRTSVRDLHEYC